MSENNRPAVSSTSELAVRLGGRMVSRRVMGDRKSVV